VLRQFGLEDFVPTFRWAVVTLGTFDGVHRGHQHVLSQTLAWAREHQGESVVLTFRRPPRTVTQAAAEAILMSLDHRLLLFERLGIDVAVVLEFDPTLAAMEPADFVRRILLGRLQARGIFLGFNCRFGRDAAGDFDLLQALAAQEQFEARRCEPILHQGQPISSTGIRQSIIEGRLEEAAAMLGRPVSVLGTVVPGYAVGRRIGFPTANLDLHHEARPPAGVYLCRAQVQDAAYPALTSIGRRPTFTDGKGEELTEVLLLDFEGELYGQDLEVHFLKKLRDQEKFPGETELRAQVARDVAALRQTWAKMGREN
jgi:riboflavin kinase/FMN adenylyltransferase